MCIDHCFFIFMYKRMSQCLKRRHRGMSADPCADAMYVWVEVDVDVEDDRCRGDAMYIWVEVDVEDMQ